MRSSLTGRLGPWCSLCVLCVLGGNTLAQLPHARLDRVFPLGGQAGSEVVIELSGKDLDEVKSLHFDHPGFHASPIKPNQFRVAIAPEVPPGTYEIRAVGKYGISGSRLFAVSHGLTEVREVEPNDSSARAQRVPLNCAINGQSDNNGDDFFRFPAKRGDRITIDCQAFRLDSMLRATLVLSSADGKELARSKPYHNRTDPFLDFIAPADGDYLVLLHDMTFSGGLPYRLIISNRPQIEHVYPPAIEAGKTIALTVYGRNLPGGKPAPEVATLDLPLEKVQVAFTSPTDPVLLQRFAFINHPATPSLNARGMQVWPKDLENVLNPATLLFASDPVVLEQEPNDTADKAQEVTLPAVICGRFDRPRDPDWYRFTAKAGQQIAVDLLCERMDMPGDPFVLITDARGNELATFDDHGINFNALAQFNRDPLGAFTVPANGTYRVLVQERYQSGGARFLYALHLGKPEPDFYPVAIHESNPDPTCPVVRQGGCAFYEVCLNRRHFNGPVTIEAEGLPPGVTCPAVHVSPQTQFVTVVFTAAPDAEEWVGAIRLKARAKINGVALEREVRCAQRRWPIANITPSRVCREICLAVRSTAPYGLHAQPEATVAAGGHFEAKVRIQRNWPDFKGKVQLIGLNLPPGFGVTVAEIPAHQESVSMKFTVAGNVPPGTYSVVVRGDAQVPFQRSPGAATKPNVRVTDPSTPMLVTVNAPPKK